MAYMGMGPAPPCRYKDYYLSQTGGALPVFTGSVHQLGHGWGSIFSSLGRFVLPLVRRGASYLGRRALATGADIARDVLEEGKDFREASKQRLAATGKTILKDVHAKLLGQSGSGMYKRKRRQRRGTKRKAGPSHHHRKHMKRKPSDIFDS